MSRISKLRSLEHHTYSFKKLKMPVDKMEDYFEYQPCFMSDDSEEFYSLNNTPTPNEDIWKKFELLPTPPRSPKREPSSEFSLDDATDIADLMNDDIFLNPNHLEMTYPESPQPLNPNLHSKLIQDCMWSGNHANKVIEATKLRSVAPIDGVPSPDCIDPTAVFPYPIYDTKIHNLGTETPSDSEDEEVDVVSTGDEKLVTVGVQIKQEPVSPKSSPSKSRICSSRSIIETRTNTCIKVKVEPKEYVSDCSAISVHNYSLPYSHGLKRTRSTPQQTHSVVSHKRLKREHQTEPVLKSVARKLKSSSVELVSDCEENCEGKRTLHNVLERRRRNDLKDSFYVLRDHVPELDSKEKAPKVLILRKASEYIQSLRRTDSKNTRELSALRQKNEALRKKLAMLQDEIETDDDEYSID